jgi:hypothetical protein
MSRSGLMDAARPMSLQAGSSRRLLLRSDRGSSSLYLELGECLLLDLRSSRRLREVTLHLQHTSFYVTDGNIMYLTDASRSLISCVIQHYAPVVGCGGGRNRCIMLIMTLDLSWRQTIRLPPPGIEPGSPASQTGTLPEELTRQLTPV